MFGFPGSSHGSPDIVLNLGLLFDLRGELNRWGQGLLAVKHGHGNILREVLGIEGEARWIVGETRHEVVGVLNKRGGTIALSCFWK